LAAASSRNHPPAIAPVALQAFRHQDLRKADLRRDVTEHRGRQPMLVTQLAIIAPPPDLPQAGLVTGCGRIGQAGVDCHRVKPHLRARASEFVAVATFHRLAELDALPQDRRQCLGQACVAAIGTPGCRAGHRPHTVD
jgi:hypothetical protein